MSFYENVLCQSSKTVSLSSHLTTSCTSWIKVIQKDLTVSKLLIFLNNTMKRFSTVCVTYRLSAMYECKDGTEFIILHAPKGV